MYRVALVSGAAAYRLCRITAARRLSGPGLASEGRIPPASRNRRLPVPVVRPFPQKCPLFHLNAAFLWRSRGRTHGRRSRRSRTLGGRANGPNIRETRPNISRILPTLSGLTNPACLQRQPPLRMSSNTVSDRLLL